jgi:hypothetical protein
MISIAKLKAAFETALGIVIIFCGLVGAAAAAAFAALTVLILVAWRPVLAVFIILGICRYLGWV